MDRAKVRGIRKEDQAYSGQEWAFDLHDKLNRG